MVPVCTAHPSPLMPRALGLESYLKLRALIASSLQSRGHLLQLIHLHHFVFQTSLLFHVSIFTLHPDLGCEFCGQLSSLGVVIILRLLLLLLHHSQFLLQCLHFVLLQCANLLHKLWVATVEMECCWSLRWRRSRVPSSLRLSIPSWRSRVPKVVRLPVLSGSARDTVHFAKSLLLLST